MNPYLTHQMALSNQHELHRKAARARAARASAGHSRFAAIYRRIVNTRFDRPMPQTQNPAPQAIAGVISKA
jgi:hypothetical protein